MRKISYWRNLQKLNASSFPNLLPTPGQPGLEESHEILRKIFSQNFLPFWYPDVLDKELGGYRLKCDIQGRWISYENKFLVPQTRTLWFFSRLYNSPYKDEKYLEAARYGYEFIYENFWDNDFGGFYWEIEASSKAVPKPKKQIYGQAFALYALSEYAAASNDQQAYNLVGELLSVLEHNAHDTIYGGYGDFFLRNWQKSDAEQRQYIGGDLGKKTYNTHLHLLEALTSYYRITQDPAVRKRLYELIIIQSNSMVRKTIGACTERYLEDWTPVYKRDFSAVNYGHDLENIMLLSDACKALKISDFIFLDLYRTLFSYSLRFGFDYRKGGFFRTGWFVQ
jgi:mannobiose 2-epimerase